MIAVRTSSKSACSTIAAICWRNIIRRTAHTWNELERQAKEIAKGNGNAKARFGISVARAASEALTCNALEWQIPKVELAPETRWRVSLERAPMIQALERARRWIGTVSPPDVTAT